MTATLTSSSGVAYVRTPDDRLAQLPDFSYPPAYVEVDGLRMAYVDVGPSDGPPILLLHGEPTWSFLYRRMIPPLVDAGFRCVAPDLIGFGRSDKPVDREIYTCAAHVSWMETFLDSVALPPATLFAQDWGGLIGLRVERVPGAARQPHQEFRPGGHFLQDDRGENVAAALVDWLKTLP